MNWLNSLFTDANGVTPWWGVALAILIMLAIGAAITAVVVAIVNAVRKSHEGKEFTRSQWTVRELIFGALCIAIAFALSYLRFFEMPQGGSITPASMLPIVMFAYVYGTPKGLIVALAYGLLQLLQDAYVVHWAQLIMDYCLAFLPLALAGLFKKSMLPGVLIGGLGRLVFSTLSGVIFFAEYAGDQNVWLYSVIYNGTYLLPDTAICFVIALIPGIRKAVDLFKAQAQGRRKAEARA
jgi:thiamine transporter